MRTRALAVMMLLVGVGAVPAALPPTVPTLGSSPVRSRPAPALRGKTTSVRIYLVALGNGTKARNTFGCGDRVVAVTRSIPPTTQPLSAAIRLLLSDHHRFYGRSGLYNALYQSHLRLSRAAVKNGRASVYLAGKTSLGGVCDVPRVKQQLQHTALQFRTVKRAAFFINGIPLSKLLSAR